MNLVRVIRKLDDSVAVIIPAPKARRKNEPDQVFLDRVYQKAIRRNELKPDEPTEFEGLPFVDIDKSDLPDRANRDKWRMKAGDSKPKVDPSIITVVERRQAIENQLDAEIAKGENAANMFKIVKLRRKLETRDYSA